MNSPGSRRQRYAKAWLPRNQFLKWLRPHDQPRPLLQTFMWSSTAFRSDPFGQGCLIFETETLLY